MGRYGVRLVASVVLAALMSGLFSSGVFARPLALVVDLVAVADGGLFLRSPERDYGAGESFEIGLSGTTVNRSLVKFDLSGETVGFTSATLVLGVLFTDGIAGDVEVYRVRRDWVEGTGDGSAGTVDGATWNTYDGVNLWTVAGVGDTSADRDSVLLGTAVLADTLVEGDIVSISLDVAMVEAMVPGGAWSNYGFVLVSANESTGFFSFCAKDSPYAGCVGKLPTLSLLYPDAATDTPTPAATDTPTPAATDTPAPSATIAPSATATATMVGTATATATATATYVRGVTGDDLVYYFGAWRGGDALVSFGLGLVGLVVIVGLIGRGLGMRK